MNLIEQIYKGVELIERGTVSGKDTAPLQDKVKTLQARLNEEVEHLKLLELAARDIAVEIYSEILNCRLWLCSNKKMAAQIREDALEELCYTVDELRHPLSLDPSPESLKTINEAKAVFPGSTIVETDKSFRHK